MSRLERLERLAADFLIWHNDRQRLSRRLMAAGFPGLATRDEDAALWRAIHAAIDELERAAIERAVAP
jgi:hypothetical protein